MTDKITEQDFGYGEELVITEGISGAPAGTKVLFMQAVNDTTARVKVTERKPELAGNDVCYTRDAKITVPLGRLAKDDGSFKTGQKQQKKDAAWRPCLR